MTTANTTVVQPESIVTPQTVRDAVQAGGFVARQSEGNTYVTEVTLAQQIINEYQNVTQSTTTVTNQAAGSNGLIQYYKDGAFAANTFLNYDEANIVLTVAGNVVAGNFVTGGSLNAPSITSTGTASLAALNVSGLSNFAGNVTVGEPPIPKNLTVWGDLASGNLSVGDNSGNTRTAFISGNLTAANVAGGNLVSANYFSGQFDALSAAQSNITSVANTLAAGNIKLLGNTASSLIVATDDQPIRLGSSNTAGSGNIYALTVSPNGNVTLPQSTGGQAVVYTQGDLTLAAVGSNYTFGQSGTANLANNVVANYFTGTLAALANSQPNITTVGTLLQLTVANSGAGNITADNTLVGNLSNTANLVVTATANITTGNIGNLFVTANANVFQLNADDGAIAGNLSVGGNLFVAGNTTTINVTQLLVQDPIATLGGGPNGAPLTTNDGKDRGIQLSYYTTSAVNAFMGWDNSVGEFILGSSVTNTNEVITVSTYGNLRADTLYANLGGNLVSGNSNVSLIANGNVSVAVAGNSGVLVVTGSGANVAGYVTLTGNLGAGNAVLGNLASANYFTGNLVNGNSGVVVNANSNVDITAAGVANVLRVTAAGANVAGNLAVTDTITAANLVGAIANGNSNITLIANSNVTVNSGGNATATFTPTGANIIGYVTATGNITGANASLGNLVVANYFSGNLISGTSNITIPAGGNVRVSVGGNPNIFVVTSAGVEVVGNVRATFANIQTSIVTDSGSFEIANTTATTINLGGAATTLNLGATTGNTAVKNNLDVSGNTQSGNVYSNTGTVRGNVVSAAGYIQLPVYATNAARDGAITSPANGMMIYNTSVGKFQGYAAGAWVDLN